LQLASYESYTLAKRTFDRVCTNRAYVILSKTGRKRLYYALRVGPFKTYSEAKREKKRIKNLYGFDAQILKRDYYLPQTTLVKKKKGCSRKKEFYPERFFSLYKKSKGSARKYLFLWRHNFPKAPYPYYLYSLIHLAQKDYKGAAQRAEKALNLGGDFTELFTQLGVSLSMSKEAERAIPYFEKAYRRRKGEREFLNYLSALLATNNLSSALSLVKTEEKKFDTIKNPYLLYTIYAVYEASGDKEGASVWLNRLKALKEGERLIRRCEGGSAVSEKENR